MEIYTFHSSYNTVMNIIYALIAITLGVVSFILIRFLTSSFSDRRDKRKSVHEVGGFLFVLFIFQYSSFIIH